jgi:hypothetical protein
LANGDKEAQSVIEDMMILSPMARTSAADCRSLHAARGNASTGADFCKTVHFQAEFQPSVTGNKGRGGVPWKILSLEQAPDS